MGNGMKTVIFANGQLSDPTGAMAHCRKAELIIAVDGGARHCRDLDILPHVLLGDLDSISSSLLAHYERGSVKIIRHPADKDKSDLELALDLALEQQAERATIFGGLGLRWDMSIVNLLLPAAPSYETMEICLIEGSTRVHLLRGGKEFSLSATPGTTVSLIPLSGTAEGVSLAGFKYQLDRQTISHASTLGVSNVLLGRVGTISLHTGLLLCIVDES